MGEIVLIREGISELLPMTKRSDGTHVSHIIHDLCVKLGHYQPRAEGDEPNQAMFELGNALEHAIIDRYTLDDPDRYVRPGELEKDGMFGTPDLFDMFDDAVEECKLTWMSARHAPDSQKFWKYWVQVKAYCWMVGWTVGRLHVCFVNGDYDRNKPPGPIYRVWEQRFTTEELIMNWRMLINRAEALRRGAKGT